VVVLELKVENLRTQQLYHLSPCVNLESRLSIEVFRFCTNTPFANLG
jgi:hypothetical protein